jgi:hypothetical protein
MRTDTRLMLAAVTLVSLVGLAAAQHSRHPLSQPASSNEGQAGLTTTGQQGSPSAGQWTPLTHQPSFLVFGAANPILLTDGTVLVQDAGSSDWWKLTPDQSGSYANGTWTQIASLPSTYKPLYYSSAVLPDGRLIIEGGEYLAFVSTWSNLGAIYDPLANTWAPVQPPAGWTGIGDAQSVVLADGTYMQASCCSTEAALLDAKTLTWTSTGTNKLDSNNEEGWTLLPNGKVLTVDSNVSLPGSELYSPDTGAWQSAGSTLVELSGESCSGGASSEIGPGVLRPDGTVFYAGANRCGPGNTAIYDSYTGIWTAGPVFPGGNGMPDGPAALEPNGKVLMMASVGGSAPAAFFEWDGQSFQAVAGTPNAVNDAPYVGNMLVLPTGEILLTDFSRDIELYTPAPSSHPEWAPVIHQAQSVLEPGGSYTISGVRFNGMSQGAAYGDDVQAATNYPLVRITNLATGHVSYSRTHDHSSMAVASENAVSTQFDVPTAQELGQSKLEVVANGIPSDPVFVSVIGSQKAHERDRDHKDHRQDEKEHKKDQKDHRED